MAATLPELQTLDRAALESLVERLHGEVERLELLPAKLKRAQFGRRSEAMGREIAQLELFLEELRTAQSAPGTVVATPEAPARPVRQPLPAHLPRETRRIEPDTSACPACGGELRALGEDVSEMLEYVPASFRVIRQVRPKLACGRCDQIVLAPAPSRPIARGLAGPSLLAHVLTSIETRII